MNLCNNISDNYLRDNYDRCLSPVLQLLSTAHIRTAPQSYLKDIGKCWVLIGLLRLRLLLPSSPIDPATKSLIKVGHINNEISLYENHVKTYVLLSSLTGRMANPPHVQRMLIESWI